MANSFTKEALDLALSQKGVSDHGRNTGREVDRYLASTGTRPPAAWCAAFVYWAISETARKRGLQTVPFIKSAYCPTIHNWADERGLLMTKPQAGDVFLIYGDYPSGRFAFHTGFVTGATGGRFSTIEGNTNMANSAEGDGVYERSRPINAAHKFIRWPQLLPLQVDAVEETYKLIINGEAVADMPVRDGRSLCPLRKWADHWGITIAWDHEHQMVLFDGKPVPVQVHLMDGASYAPINDLIMGTRLKSKVSVPKHEVTLAGQLG